MAESMFPSFWCDGTTDCTRLSLFIAERLFLGATLTVCGAAESRHGATREQNTGGDEAEPSVKGATLAWARLSFGINR